VSRCNGVAHSSLKNDKERKRKNKAKENSILELLQLGWGTYKAAIWGNYKKSLTDGWMSGPL